VSVWIAIAATAAGCYLLKLLGMTLPEKLLENAGVRRFALLAPVALIAALTALQTFGARDGLTVDARAAGLVAAAVAVVLRAPFLVVIATAVLVTAAVRALAG
jgi:branched-subunit amino acid transport protein